MDLQPMDLQSVDPPSLPDLAFGRVIPRFHRTLIVCLLGWSLGFQWFSLQAVAWGSMLVQRTVQSDWKDAVQTTFGGQHPCELCRVVQSAQAEDDDASGSLRVPQLEWISDGESTPWVEVRLRPVPVYATVLGGSQRGTRPPVPPPRSA